MTGEKREIFYGAADTPEAVWPPGAIPWKILSVLRDQSRIQKAFSNAALASGP